MDPILGLHPTHTTRILRRRLILMITSNLRTKRHIQTRLRYRNLLHIQVPTIHHRQDRLNTNSTALTRADTPQAYHRPLTCQVLLFSLHQQQRRIRCMMDHPVTASTTMATRKIPWTQEIYRCCDGTDPRLLCRCLEGMDL